MLNFKRRCFLLTLAVALLFSFASARGSEQAISKIQKAYEGIKDIRGSFVQKSYIKDLNRTDTFRGAFSIKMPSMMRWQYSGGRQNVEVIINNGDIIIYQKDEKQAFRSRFDRDTYGQAPIALLGGFSNIEKEFDVSERNGKLILRPKSSMGNIAYLELSPSDGKFPIGSLAIVDSRSNKVEITLKDVVLNTGVRDSLFEFSLPRGVSMFDKP